MSFTASLLQLWDTRSRTGIVEFDDHEVSSTFLVLSFNLARCKDFVSDFAIGLDGKTMLTTRYVCLAMVKF